MKTFGAVSEKVAISSLGASLNGAYFRARIFNGHGHMMDKLLRTK
jgi:hypothetical protein